MPLMLALGLGLVALGVWVADEPSVATALVVMGAAIAAFALLRYHLHEHVSLGPSGLKSRLTDPRKEIEKIVKGATEEALDKAQQELPPGTSIVIEKSGGATSKASAGAESELLRSWVDQVATSAARGTADLILARDECAQCGFELEPNWDKPTRRPCPRCGSLQRSYFRNIFE